jgi:hypothetical protein
MSKHQPVTAFVTWDQVAAFRLARHHLLEPAPASALMSVARDMTGAQAQLLSAAQISLSARSRDLQPVDVERALNERKLVKASCMRQTLFLVPAADLAVFVRGSARRAEKEIRWTLGKGVPERAVDAAIGAALAALDQPLTRPEIAERVSRMLGVRTRSVQGGGWGSRRKLAAVPVGDLTFPVVDLLHLVAARGVVCYGPNRGSEQTFVRADAWIPRWKDVPVNEAERRLLRLYLRAHGPATATDFAMWTGMTLTEARAIWASEQSKFASVDVQGWTAAVLQDDLDALTQARFERPSVCLLPHFDSFLLGHKDRTHLVRAEHHPRIYRSQGWISPVVLVNGRVVAVWEAARQADRLLVKVTKFDPLSRQLIKRLHEEARDLADFLGSQDAQVELTPG